MPQVEVHSLCKRYGAMVALNEVTFSADPGALTVVRGPSASGKTTLLRCIAGLERPDAGTLSIAGQRVSGDGVWVPPVRRRLGMVFQDHALWPHMTVRGHIDFVLRAARVPKPERAARIGRLLELLDLADCERAFPHALSGGQQQRVGIARALALDSHVLLFDEPFANLDERLRRRILAELQRRRNTQNVTVLLATHDVDQLQIEESECQIVELGARQ